MYKDVAQSINEHCTKLGRIQPKLIAVSKTQPNDNVENVLKQGHCVFGENRVQEAAEKWPNFQEQYGKVELHLLGPLQTNKVKQALSLFDVIHSLDRMKLARKIAEESKLSGKSPELFIQVNIGNEPQKAGVAIDELDEFLSETQKLNLNIVGLMCIPPVDENPRPFFQKLRQLREQHGLKYLSMGMSGDYLTAIEEGATHVRVGSAIFGARDYA